MFSCIQSAPTTIPSLFEILDEGDGVYGSGKLLLVAPNKCTHSTPPILPLPYFSSYSPSYLILLPILHHPTTPNDSCARSPAHI